MALSSIFNAIGRGYTAKSVLDYISREYPKHSGSINKAMAAGYTAESILSHIASKNSKKSYPPEMFMTDHEKGRALDNENRRKGLMQAIGILGVAGAATAGAYALSKGYKPKIPTFGKNKPISPEKNPNFQENQAIPQMAQQIEQKEIQNDQPSIDPSVSEKNVRLVNAFKEEQRFKNVLDAGHDLDTSELLLRQIMPKNMIHLMDKAEGGLRQVLMDFAQHVKQTQSQGGPGAEEKPQGQQPIQPIPKAQIQQIPGPAGEAQPIGNLQQQQNAPQTGRQMPPMGALEPEIPNSNVNQNVISPTPTAPIEAQNTAQAEPNQVSPEQTALPESGIKPTKVRKRKEKEFAPDSEIKSLIRKVIDHIPEKLKSTNVMSTAWIPENQIMIVQFYDGKWAYYKDVPQDVYQQLASGEGFAPTGEEYTGIAQYHPDVADSRGNAFHKLIKNNDYYKTGKGKTWDYASSQYSLFANIQREIHEISKERYTKERKRIS